MANGAALFVTVFSRDDTESHMLIWVDVKDPSMNRNGGGYA